MSSTSSTLDKVLAGKHVAVSASIGETTESIERAASARDLETMFQLVYLRMTAPRKDEQAFAVWRANFAEQLANQRRDPRGAVRAEVAGDAVQGQPAPQAPEPADVEKVDHDKALAFYKDRFGDATDFTFVIVGVVDLEKLKPLVETYLASLPAKGRKEKEKDVGVREVGGVVKKSWALGQEPKARGPGPVPRRRDVDARQGPRHVHPRRRDGDPPARDPARGHGRRVRRRRRWQRVARRRHQERSFSIQFGCAPEAVDKLIKAAFDEAAVVAKNGIGADYLAKVKEQFLRERETSLKTNGAGRAGCRSRIGSATTRRSILDPTKMTARMTSDNVKAAAKRYLDQKQYYQAVMLPAAPAAPAAPATPTKN